MATHPLYTQWNQWTNLNCLAFDRISLTECSPHHMAVKRSAADRAANPTLMVRVRRSTDIIFTLAMERGVSEGRSAVIGLQETPVTLKSWEHPQSHDGVEHHLVIRHWPTETMPKEDISFYGVPNLGHLSG